MSTVPEVVSACAADGDARSSGPPRSGPRARGVWDGLPGEVLVVVLGAVVITGWTSRPMLRSITTTVGGDLGDPVYFAWQLAWVRHALLSDPGGLWTTTAFLPASDNLAFTDAVLGYAPLGLLLPGGQAGAVALLNLAGLAATVLALVGGYALVRALGGGQLAALVAGTGFGFAPWRITQTVHVNVVSTGGIALALALLARGNGWSLREGWRPERMSWRWVAAGWAVACYQLTFGFAIGIWFGYVLGIAMLLWAVGWLVSGRRRARLPWGLMLAHAVGGAGFAASVALLVRPYLRVFDAYRSLVERKENWLPLFSPPWQGLLTAPEADRFWGGRQTGWRRSLTWLPEMAMSPGWILLGLALLGTVVSVWPWRRRLAVIVATGVLVVLSMGTAFPLGHGEWTYLPLFRYAPGWSALRTPGRLMIFVTLGLAILAGGAVARVYQSSARAVRRPSGAAPPRAPARVAAATGLVVAVAVLPVLVVGEGLSTVRRWPVPVAPLRLATLRQPVLILPFDPAGDYHMMLWDTEGWPLMANGYSSFDPPAQTALRAETRTFPDPASVAALRARGIADVLVVRSRAVGTAWEQAADRSVDGLGITRSDLGEAVVFDLHP